MRRTDYGQPANHSCKNKKKKSKQELERMIVALLEGAEKGYEGPVPGIYLSLSLKFPNSTRFAMSNMADRPCGAVTAPDYVRAHMWLSIFISRIPASSEDDPVRALAVVIRERRAAVMTRAQIANARKLAREWKPEPE